MKKILFLLVSCILFISILFGIPQDTLRALKGSQPGDHIRYFRYLQTARHEGVPAALIKYGVEP